MAYFKAKLTEQGFPFNFQELAGTVLIGNALEQNLQGQQAGQEIPQAYFMQNVLPSQRGLSSIHYTRVVAEHVYPRYLDKIFVLYDSVGSVALYSTAYGQRYVYDKDVAAWAAFPLPDNTVIGDTTIAYLKGTTYILIAGVGLYSYNFSTKTIDALVLSGVNANTLKGITAAGLYLVAWTDSTVYWSNPLDPLDFVPAQGGAGSSSILSNRSRILQCLPATDSFIAYTTRSAIYCNSTGNANFPFSFREIPSSAGVESNEHVAYDAPNDRHIAWTTSGFQLVNQKGASLIWPELSDSIGQGLYSGLGSGNYPFIGKSDKLGIKVSSIGARFIAVSIKRNEAQISYGYAYIYDIALERWGRLDIPHIDFFEYRAPEFVAALTFNDMLQPFSSYDQSFEQLVQEAQTKTSQFGFTLGCVGANGAIHIALGSNVANLTSLESAVSGAAEPAVLLGRYRLQRPNAVQTQQLQLSTEGLAEATVSMIAHDAHGTKIRSIQPMQSVRSQGLFQGRITGAHISFAIGGRFNLTSLEAELVSAGSTLLPVTPTAQVGLNTVVVQDVPVVTQGQYVEVL